MLIDLWVVSYMYLNVACFAYSFLLNGYELTVNALEALRVPNEQELFRLRVKPGVEADLWGMMTSSDNVELVHV